MVAAFFFTDLNQLDEAHAHLIDVEKKGLRIADLYSKLSQTEARLGDEAKARSYLEKVVELDLGNKTLLHDLKLAYRKTGKFDKTIDTLKQLLPKSRFDLALSYFTHQKYIKTSELFEQLTQFEPTNVD